MRIHLGPIPESPDFVPDRDEWVRLREPRLFLFQVGAAVVGVVAAVGIALLWSQFTPAFATPPREGPPPHPDLIRFAGAVVFFLVGLVLVHELLHAMAQPGCGLRRESLLGVWPAKLLPYAHYDGPMSRGRFVAVMLCPFAVLSLGLLVVGVVGQYAPPLLLGGSVVNALFAGGDLLGTAILVTQIPARAQVRNQGWWTWWRKVTDAAADGG